MILRGLKMLLLLVSCWIITGIMADGPSTTHYARKNSSVCLHVQKSPSDENVRWKIAGTFIFNGKKINPEYEKRVFYSPENFSLCINELTDKDTGIYEASFMDSKFKEVSEANQVIVEEMIPRPIMMMSLRQSNLSAGFCNITVNCSVQDDWLWFVCEEDSCQTSQKSFSKFNITIYTDNTSVVCSANNHVSRNNASESIANCYRASKPEHKQRSTNLLLIGLISAVCTLLFFCFIILAKKLIACCHHRRYFQESTHAARMIQSQPVEAHSQPEPRLSTSSSSQAEPCYENVDVPQPNETSSPREELGSKESHQVDTVYSILQMPNAAVCLGTSDSSRGAKGHENKQDALSSESATLDEAQRSIQVDTVYSMLQKKNSTTNR